MRSIPMHRVKLSGDNRDEDEKRRHQSGIKADTKQQSLEGLGLLQ